MARSLVEEFCAETSDLLDAVAEALLAIEQDPSGDVVDRLFRSLHTIKGASGIFPIGPFTAAVHAAEDVIAAVRDGALGVCAEMVDDLLAANDQLRAWLDPIQATGGLGPDGGESAALQRRLRRWTGRPDAGDGRLELAGPEQARSWLNVLPTGELGRCRDWLARTGARVRLVRYEPAPDAFFQGEDPVALLRGVPAVEVAGAVLRAKDGGTEGFDCNLIFVALTRAKPAEIAVALAATAGSVAVADLGAADLVPTGAGDPAGIARQLLEAQIAALARPTPAAQLGARLRAGAAAAAGALRVLAPGPEAGLLLAAALDEALEAQDPLPLVAGLEVALAKAGPGGGEAAGHSPAAVRPPVARSGSAPVADHHLRIDRATVDRLVRYSGELVVAANALPYLARRAEHEGSRDLARDLATRAALTRRVVNDLQALVLDLRMLPVGLVFDRFPRLVRDVTRHSGKRIRLDQQGADVLADADIVDALGEALVHLVRNAVDHGIEAPDVRRAADKPEEGTLLLSAWEETDGLVVEVTDDGRGMDVQALRRDAVAAGLVSSDAAARLSDEASTELAFLPGLSTAAEVSELSGRGVGLDAVRAALRAVHGTVTVDSQPGRGTTVRIRLPRSISITDALVVLSGGQHFGIPIDQVRETTRVPASGRRRLGRNDVVQLHGAPVPLRTLDALLSLGTGSTSAPSPTELDDGTLVLVANTEAGPLALAIDGIEGREEVLVQPLLGVLAGHPGVLGTSLRADGSVLIVLDAGEVSRAS